MADFSLEYERQNGGQKSPRKHDEERCKNAYLECEKLELESMQPERRAGQGHREAGRGPEREMTFVERDERAESDWRVRESLPERQRPTIARPMGHEPDWIGLGPRDAHRRRARREIHIVSPSRAVRTEEDEDDEYGEVEDEDPFSRDGVPLADIDQATLLARWTK